MESWEDKAKTWLKGMFGDTQEKKVKFLQDYVIRANAFEPQFEKMSDDELKGKTVEFRTRIDNALRDVPDKLLIPADASKMPGQLRTEKDRVLAGVPGRHHALERRGLRIASILRPPLWRRGDAARGAG